MKSERNVRIALWVLFGCCVAPVVIPILDFINCYAHIATITKTVGAVMFWGESLLLAAFLMGVVISANATSDFRQMFGIWVFMFSLCFALETLYIAKFHPDGFAELMQYAHTDTAQSPLETLKV